MLPHSEERQYLDYVFKRPFQFISFLLKNGSILLTRVLQSRPYVLDYAIFVLDDIGHA